MNVHGLAWQAAAPVSVTVRSMCGRCNGVIIAFPPRCHANVGLAQRRWHAGMYTTPATGLAMDLLAWPSHLCLSDDAYNIGLVHASGP